MRDQGYVVKLRGQERKRLEGMIRKGKMAAQQQTRVRILLHADKGKHGSGWNDPPMAKAVGCCEDLCWRVRRPYVTEGLEAVITREKRETPPVPPIFDGAREARLIQLACSPPPEGTAMDSAHMLKEIADKHFPKSKTIVLVQDNLNTHKPAPLCEAFPPEEARIKLKRLYQTL